jgi:MFS family permease
MSSSRTAVSTESASRRWIVLAVVGFAQLMVVLDATIVNIALPSAQADLNFSTNDRQWIITAYSLAFGSLLLFGGKISDLLGRKRTFIIGIIGFAAASAFGGAAQSFEWLVTARVIQGAFGALLAPTSLAVLTTTFTIPKERARAFGVFGAIAGAGGAIGLLLGGVLTQSLNWRWNLYVNDVIAVFAIIGAIMFVKHVELDGPRPKLDFLGTALATLGLFSLVFGFSHANTDGWGAFITWGPLVASGVLLIAFVLWQRRAREPLLPLSILADRNRGAAFSSILIAGVGISASSSSSPTTCRQRCTTRPCAPVSRSCR